MSKLTDDIRSKQKGKKLTKAEIYAKFEEFFTAHDKHNKKQVGPCVYCSDCNIRLYQGKL